MRSALPPQKTRPSRWRAAGTVLRSHLHPLPSVPAGPPPRLGCRGRVVTYSLAALGLLVICLIAALGKPGQASPASSAATPPRSGTTTPTSSGTSFASVSPVEQASRFLAAYFTWGAEDTDSAYAARWQAYVLPAALTQVISVEPLLLLDHGTDAASTSPAPAVTSPKSAQAGQLVLRAAWTIQVLTEGGEGSTWQPRHIQATLTVVQTPDAPWLIREMTWMEGGTA